MKFYPLQFAIAWLFFLSGNFLTQASTFYVVNKCPFTIWPAIAPNNGHPVLANGGFHLPPGRARKFQAPGDWSGRFWARTNCTFGHKLLSCETGDCNGKLECNGSIGQPPATLVEFALNENKPDFYDVSVVDGYNLPVQVISSSVEDNKCNNIGGCVKDLKSACPSELQVLNGRGDVVACESACLAFDSDRFCCRNEFFGPDKCKASVYSKVFKDACPYYVSYAFDAAGSVVSCTAAEYVIAFCPDKWGYDTMMDDAIMYLDDDE